MLLDVGVSATKITDEDYDDPTPSDAFAPHVEESFEDIENVIDDFFTENNDTSVNFNGDVSKIAINDILNEMRMGSPIQNDLLNDLISDDVNNNIFHFGNGDFGESNNNETDFYDKNLIQNYGLKEEIFKDNDENNVVDQFLNFNEFSPPSTPDMKFEFTDVVKFEYDANEQFGCDPDVTLSFYEDPDSTEVPFQDSGGVSFNITNNNDSNNPNNSKLDSDIKESEPSSSKQYFECSTNLPMTTEELQLDIKKYLNSEQNYSYASFYEYVEMINNTAEKQTDNAFDYPYSNEMIQEYITEQNLLFQRLESVKPIILSETTNTAPIVDDPMTVENAEPAKDTSTEENTQAMENGETRKKRKRQGYNCHICSYTTSSLQGLSVHMSVHSDEHLRCPDCNFTTINENYLKRHQDHYHGTVYSCKDCNYETHSALKIQFHIRDEH